MSARSTSDSSDSGPLPRLRQSRSHVVPRRRRRRLRTGAPRNRPPASGPDADGSGRSTSTASTKRTCKATLIDGAEAGRRHQGATPSRRPAHRPRGGRSLRAAPREDAGAARGHPARNRRPETEAPGCRDDDRGDDPDACATRSSSSASRKRASATSAFCSIGRGTPSSRQAAAGSRQRRTNNRGVRPPWRERMPRRTNPAKAGSHVLYLLNRALKSVDVEGECPRIFVPWEQLDDARVAALDDGVMLGGGQGHLVVGHGNIVIGRDLENAPP